jgi:predicted RND superfamily exporter protein
MAPSFDYQRLIDWADDRIVETPGRVLLAFLVVTAVFGVGLGNVSTSSGTQQFASDTPAQEALDAINEEFSEPFTASTGSTQLIQRGENVLSKKGLLRMLRAQDRVAENEALRVSGTSSAATIVALQLDPTAETRAERIDAVERATPGEIDRAVRAASENPRFAGLLSNDFNRESASASATIGVITHTIPQEVSQTAGQGGSSPFTDIQLRTRYVVGSVGGDIVVFGSGILSEEFGSVIGDTIIIVMPAAVLFIVLFLVVAYRDLMDLMLGIVALLMAIVWTFGFMGLAGIPFSQMLIAVPPLLLAVGIDFGIHAVNRYREERETGLSIRPAMRRTTDQLLVAFFIVMGTTVIGFSANLTSALPPIRDFGIVASVGIVFTFLVFGVFVPAAKVYLDTLREQYPLPTFSQRPLGSEGSKLGRVLNGGVAIAERAPVAFLLVVLVASAGMGVYATDIGTSFTNEDFLPPEETPWYLDDLPEPFHPSEYTVVGTLNFLEEKFQSGQGDSVTIYVEGEMGKDAALEGIYRAGRDPPGSFVTDDRRAESTSIVTIIQDQAARDPEFRAVVERNDRNDNGVPDDDLGEVYDALLETPARGQALDYLTEDRRSARVVYSVEADASQADITADAQELAGRFRYDATATGNTVVFESISSLILSSAITSLAIAFAGTALFLVFIYWVLVGRPSLGVANLVPILVTVLFLAGSMRALGVSFNAFTATILAITIGLGIDYSVHVVHRFADEYEERDLSEALERTVRGTGGALTGSLLTTVFGIGVLVLSIFPAIGQFGLLTGLSVFYSFFASLYVLPATLVVWHRLVGDDAPSVAA